MVLKPEDFLSAAIQAMEAGDIGAFVNGVDHPIGQPKVEQDVPAAITLLDDLDSFLNADVGAAFRPDIIAAMVLVQKHDQAAWARTKLVLKKHHISLRDLQKAISKMVTAGETDDGSAQHERLAGDVLPDCPAASMIVPAGFVLDVNGTYEWRSRRDVFGGETVSSAVVAHAPIVISGRLRDLETRTESLRINWRRPDGWREHIVDRAVALDKNKVIER